MNGCTNPRVGGWLVALLSLAVLPIEFPGPVAGQPPKGDYPVGGLIGERYQKLGGARGPLGRPTSKEMDARGGRQGPLPDVRARRDRLEPRDRPEVGPG